MKLTKKEHANLQGLVEGIKQVESAIGQLELQKSNAINAMRERIEILDKTKKVLTKKYGDVSIDVATGNIKKANEETK
jgi:archaellum component FlaC|tara:strand:- start:5942 stop:6175 length:234 start_codon:yes stop_codon:yes gene_type:complete